MRTIITDALLVRSDPLVLLEESYTSSTHLFNVQYSFSLFEVTLTNRRIRAIDIRIESNADFRHTNSEMIYSDPIDR